MKKILVTLLLGGMPLLISAQDNMEAFRHLSIGGEIGLHGVGVEVAVPIQRHLVIKAGYNWVPSNDWFNTEISLDTKDLKSAQENYETYSAAIGKPYKFQNKFGNEAIVNAGLQLGLTNYKAMINWYPFASGRFYIAGGVYYTPEKNQDEPFIRLSGNTTEKDWAALKELKEKTDDNGYELALEIGDERYAVIEKNGCGYMQADFRMDPLKYYVGMGLGRCVPNNRIGLQLEIGAMIYHNGLLYCQDKEVGSILDAAKEFGNDAQEIIEYVDKYPVYPQLTLRLCFRMF